MADYSISVYHDVRTEKKGGVYPVKIRVYYDYKTRLFPINIDLSVKDFERSYLAEKPRGEDSERKDEIIEALARAKRIAKDIKPFSLNKFQEKFLTPKGSESEVFHYFRKKIKELEKEEQIKTASNYDLTEKSLKRYLESKNKDTSKLSFEDITVKFLEGYEKWMLSIGNNLTTVGIYCRNLRHIFNLANVPEDFYPFGDKKGLYTIPGGNNIKKAFEKEELQLLFTYDVGEDEHLKKARHFWFFSYQANGMNIRDICALQYQQLEKDRFTFYRTKTRRTTKKNPKLIEVILTPYLKEVIQLYGNKNSGPKTYVFPIFNNLMTAKEKVRACEVFTRYINQHMKRLAKLVGVDENISTYYARHSNASITVNSGGSLEFVSEAFGHQSITTTQNYFKGFTQKKKVEVANNLMDFTKE